MPSQSTHSLISRCQKLLQPKMLMLILLLSFANSISAQRNKDCPHCYGSGDCPTCHGLKGERFHNERGERFRECGACNGSGKCTYCGGSGYDPNYTPDPDPYSNTPVTPVIHDYTISARDISYHAVQFSTDNGQTWTGMVGSTEPIPGGWSNVSKYELQGEDDNYFFVSNGATEYALPKNSQGDIFIKNSGTWQVSAYQPHNRRSVHVDVGRYSYHKTFYGPVWILMLMPEGGSGTSSFIRAYREISEDGQTVVITDGNDTQHFTKPANEQNSSWAYTAPLPTEPMKAEPIVETEETSYSSETADEPATSQTQNNSNNNAYESDYRPSYSESTGSGTPVILWIIIAILAAISSALATYIFVKKRPNVNIPKIKKPKLNVHNLKMPEFKKLQRPQINFSWTSKHTGTLVGGVLYAAAAVFAVMAIYCIVCFCTAKPKRLYLSKNWCNCTVESYETIVPETSGYEEYVFKSRDDSTPCRLNEFIPTDQILASGDKDMIRTFVHQPHDFKRLSEAMMRSRHNSCGRLFGWIIYALATAAALAFMGRRTWQHRADKTFSLRYALQTLALGLMIFSTSFVVNTTLAFFFSRTNTDLYEDNFDCKDYNQDNYASEPSTDNKCYQVYLGVSNYSLPFIQAHEEYSFTTNGPCRRNIHRPFNLTEAQGTFNTARHEYRSQCWQRLALTLGITLILAITGFVLRKRE